jgi:hypothetical protein
MQPLPLPIRSLLLATLTLAGACRTSVPHPALSGCHPACPGASETGVADAGTLLRGDAPPAQAPAPVDATERAPSAAAYLCPMHPWIGADEPARCPECNMKLVPRADVLEHDHEG